MDELLIDLQNALEETKIRVAKIDWDYEFVEMINDPEYSPLKYSARPLVERISSIDGDEVYAELKKKYWRTSNREESLAIWAECKKVELLLQELRETEMGVMIKKWEEAEDKPNLKCRKCRYFGFCERETEDHECDPDDVTTICEHCKLECRTYERLEKHIKMKHNKKHNCKVCNISTDSDAQWERHIVNKKHKERCGIVKEEKFYPCPDCNVKPYAFPSELKRHSRTCKGRK